MCTVCVRESHVCVLPVHLSGMEAEGISVDTKVLLQYSSAVGQRVKEVEEAAHKVSKKATIPEQYMQSPVTAVCPM